jgi:hypothetical protein
LDSTSSADSTSSLDSAGAARFRPPHRRTPRRPAPIPHATPPIDQQTLF